MRISELEASLFYRVSYRTARATQKTLSQKKNKTKQNKTKQNKTFHSINIMCHFLIHDKIKTDNNFINSTQVYLQNS